MQRLFIRHVLRIAGWRRMFRALMVPDVVLCA